MSIEMKMRHKVELNAPLMTVRIPGELQEGDAEANAFVLELYRDHEPFAPDGETVTGYLTRADGNSVLLDGTLEENVITVTLSEACYRVPGFFSAFIRLTNTDGEKRTIFKATGMMSEDQQGGIVDDEHIVPTLDDIIAQMEAVEQATETANAAAQEAVQTANAASVEAVRIANEAAEESAQTANDAAQTANAAAESAAAAAAGIDEKVAEATEALAAAVDALERGKAPAIECEGSGPIVTITDGAAMPVVELISHIEPVQEGSGDPSQDNVRPISGWDVLNAYRTGKNLAGNIEKAALASVGGDIEEIVCNESYRSIFVPVVQNTMYTIRRMAIDTDMRFRAAFTSEKATVGKNASIVGESMYADSVTVLTVTTPVGARFLYVYVDNAGKEIDLSQYSIVVGDVAGEFEPYNGQTLTSDLPETVYGGTLDWTTGVLTVTKGETTFKGDEDWAQPSVGVNGLVFSVLIVGKKKGIQTSFCSQFQNVNYAFTANYENATGIYTDNDSVRNVYFRKPNETVLTLEAWKNYLAEQYAAGTPVQLCYELAEPYTIQLDPQQLDTLKGTNNLRSDCGDTSVVYVADTKMYIDNLFGSLAAAVINN